MRSAARSPAATRTRAAASWLRDASASMPAVPPAGFDPGRASPITWLVAIARNRAIDRLRASAVSRRMEPIEAADGVSDPAPAAVERVELAQQHQRLARCLEGLEARHSAAIRAAFLDGATYEELAQRMSVPLGTMKSWIRRGLLKLRACLEG